MKFNKALVNYNLAQFFNFCLLCYALLLSGCASIPDRNPLPDDLIKQAGIPGIPDARFWGDESPKFELDRFENYSEVELKRIFSGIYEQPHTYLAISGGGSNGAFGAGLFAGWTAAGTRPEFTIVTGVSTGALTAPFVFLGPKYDEKIKHLYTQTKTVDIVEKRGIIQSIFGDSLADSKPLRTLIARYITEELIAEIAKEYQRGRRLYVGTVNLDSGRSMIWNIGSIASSDYPRKIELIHDVLLASASIPIAFPPVVIPVEADGQIFDEMHVDGGTGAQVFLYPAGLDWKKVTRKLKTQGKPKVYVLRNAFLDPDYLGVKRDLLPIANRSINSLIRTQGIGDLYQIYALCERDGSDFNLAYIPSSFTDMPSEEFDPVYMKKLYELGYDLAEKGYQWDKSPPGFDVAH